MEESSGPNLKRTGAQRPAPLNVTREPLSQASRVSDLEKSPTQSPSRIVVRNTFIDICPADEEFGDSSDPSPVPRRNTSAPASPTIRESPWAEHPSGLEFSPPGESLPHVGLLATGGAHATRSDEQASLPVTLAQNSMELTLQDKATWLKHPGSPKKIPARPRKKLSHSDEGGEAGSMRVGDLLKLQSPGSLQDGAVQKPDQPWQPELRDTSQMHRPPNFQPDLMQYLPEGHRLHGRGWQGASFADSSGLQLAEGFSSPASFVTGASASCGSGLQHANGYAGRQDAGARVPPPPSQVMWPGNRHDVFSGGIDWAQHSGLLSGGQGQVLGAPVGYPTPGSLEAARAFAATLEGGGLAPHQQLFDAHQLIELDARQERTRVAQLRQAEWGTGIQMHEQQNFGKGAPKGAAKGAGAGKGRGTGEKQKTKGLNNRRAKDVEAPEQSGAAMWLSPGILPPGGLIEGEGWESGSTANKDQKKQVPLSGGGPKRTDYIKKFGTGAEEPAPAQPEGSVPITTMMLKNIPCRKNQEEVMAILNQEGFADRYDFFYLPRDVKFRANLGYAFINFVTPEDASQFQAKMNGYRFTNSGSTKACIAVAAHVQGLMNNLMAFKRTEVMRSSRKPYFSTSLVAL